MSQAFTSSQLLSSLLDNEQDTLIRSYYQGLDRVGNSLRQLNLDFSTFSPTEENNKVWNSLQTGLDEFKISMQGAPRLRLDELTAENVRIQIHEMRQKSQETVQSWVDAFDKVSQVIDPAVAMIKREKVSNSSNGAASGAGC